MSAYTIVAVAEDAPEQPEQLGTKLKFWFRGADDVRWLFKEGRPNTGENWAEKVCCELCELLGIPHAHYELAAWRRHRGVVTPTFVPKDGRLILGNELLAKLTWHYQGDRRVRAHKHTVSRVVATMRGPEKLLTQVPYDSRGVSRASTIGLPLGYTPPPEIRTATAVFIGYLMLDALTANQDRHDENWGFILTDGRITLAPTFDHASSLGRNERDEERIARMTTLDHGRSVEQYVQRARSALFGRTGRALTTLEAFQEVAKLDKYATRYWLERLRAIDVVQCRAIFENIPSTVITRPAMDFALKILDVNRGRLLGNL